MNETSKKAEGGFEADGPKVSSGSLNPSAHPSKADHPTSLYQTSKPKVSVKQIHPAVVSSPGLTIVNRLLEVPESRTRVRQVFTRSL